MKSCNQKIGVPYPCCLVCEPIDGHWQAAPGQCAVDIKVAAGRALPDRPPNTGKHKRRALALPLTKD